MRYASPWQQVCRRTRLYFQFEERHDERSNSAKHFSSAPTVPDGEQRKTEWQQLWCRAARFSPDSGAGSYGADADFCATGIGSDSVGFGGRTVDVNRRGLGVSVRGGHVAGDTVGRDDSASLFNLSPYINIGNGMLFGDARVVYGNDGGLAYNFGGGYRHYVAAWDAVAGANIFADRDSISGTHFRSWGVGGELLANGWEIRGNAYSPYGKKSVLTGVRADSNSAVFVGNNVEFSRIDSSLEALHGFDAEIG